jgi:uncharacterized membrane protein
MRTPRSVTYSAVLVGYVLGIVALYSGLPTEIPPSWTASNGDVLRLGTSMVAFLLPTAVTVTDILLRGLCVRHPIDQHSTVNVLAIFDAIMARVAVFVVGVHVAVLAGLLGLLSGREWAAQVVPLMLGITMISVGNLLPRTRPNLAIGIRTRRTLSDRAYWLKTHRRAGYLVVTCGAVVVLSALAVPRPVGPGMILLVGPAALVGTWLLLRLQGRHAHA